MKDPFSSHFKLPTRARKESITLRYDAKRKLKNVQHRQLSVHPSTHAQSPVSRASPQPSMPNIRVPLSVKTSCSLMISSSGLCHFRAHSMSVMSAVLFKNIYTSTSPIARPPCKECRIDFYAWHLCSGYNVKSRPVNQSLVCVISWHAIVRWLSLHMRCIVSLNVLSSAQLELRYKTVCASGTES